MSMIVPSLKKTPSFVTYYPNSNYAITRFVTHSGIFHPDDVIAAAITSLLTTSDFLELVRTRDTDKIKRAFDDPASVVADVGGVFDVSQYAFDHHQSSFTLLRNEIPYSSAGLLWEYLAGPVVDKVAWQHLEEKVIQPVDSLDNGIDIPEGSFADTLTRMISNFNLTWLEEQSPTDIDYAFRKAVEWTRDVLVRTILSKLAGYRAEEVVKAAFYRSELCERKVVFLNQYVPWQETLCHFPEPLYIIFPDATGKEWRLQCVPTDPEGFESRKPLPKSWGGKNDHDLDKETGIVGGVFCHKGLFICGHKTLDGIIGMAVQAVANDYDV